MRLPRLSRKQKLIRNLLAVLLLLLVTWGFRNFDAPTPGLALAWKAETYGLEKPEVLYRTERIHDQQQLLFRSGDVLAEARMYGGWFRYWLGVLNVTRIDGPAALLVQNHVYMSEIPELYVWADLPEAARAECVLRLRDVVAVNPKSEEDYFDWDETYTMDAIPNGHGVYRFLPERKYTDEGVKQQAEEVTMYQLSNNIRRGPQTDFSCEVKVTFYNDREEVVHTYEEVLAEARHQTGPGA